MGALVRLRERNKKPSLKVQTQTNQGPNSSFFSPSLCLRVGAYVQCLHSVEYFWNLKLKYESVQLGTYILRNR